MDKKSILEVAFQTTLEGIILTDSHANIILANDALENIFGYKVTRLIGKNISLFLPKFLKNIHTDYYKVFFNSPANYPQLSNPREVIGQHKDGRLIALEIRLSLFDFEGEKYVKAHISDISLRKQKEKVSQVLTMKLEAKIKKKTEELEQVVNELRSTNTTLEIEIQKKIRAKRKVRKALNAERELGKLKNSFISLASHEFRTPLSGILTSATLLDKHISQKSLAITKHLHVIKSLVKHLNNILNDFLSLERVEKGDIQYEFTSFQLNKLMQRVLDEAKTFTKDGQSLNYVPCATCPTLYQDKKILYIILTNLIFNAIKYSQENTPIDILVTRDKNISITITDKGIGIPFEDQKHIFNRFYRATNTTHLQGTGIGLNIVKSNIEALGGSISFNSIEKMGTQFTINFPQDIRTFTNLKNKQ